jgi:hypothetical protein
VLIQESKKAFLLEATGGVQSSQQFTTTSIESFHGVFKGCPKEFLKLIHSLPKGPEASDNLVVLVGRIVIHTLSSWNPNRFTAGALYQEKRKGQGVLCPVYKTRIYW